MHIPALAYTHAHHFFRLFYCVSKWFSHISSFVVIFFCIQLLFVCRLVWFIPYGRVVEYKNKVWIISLRPYLASNKINVVLVLSTFFPCTRIHWAITTFLVRHVPCFLFFFSSSAERFFDDFAPPPYPSPSPMSSFTLSASVGDIRTSAIFMHVICVFIIYCDWSLCMCIWQLAHKQRNAHTLQLYPYILSIIHVRFRSNIEWAYRMLNAIRTRKIFSICHDSFAPHSLTIVARFCFWFIFTSSKSLHTYTAVAGIGCSRRFLATKWRYWIDCRRHFYSLFFTTS